MWYCCLSELPRGGGDGSPDGQGAVAYPIPADFSRRGALRRVLVRTAMAGWLCLPWLRRPPRGDAEEPGIHIRMSRLRTPDFDYGGHGDASLQAAADDVVLGRASHCPWCQYNRPANQPCRRLLAPS